MLKNITDRTVLNGRDKTKEQEPDEYHGYVLKWHFKPVFDSRSTL